MVQVSLSESDLPFTSLFHEYLPSNYDASSPTPDFGMAAVHERDTILACIWILVDTLPAILSPFPWRVQNSCCTKSFSCL